MDPYITCKLIITFSGISDRFQIPVLPKTQMLRFKKLMIEAGQRLIGPMRRYRGVNDNVRVNRHR
jgi:hypothetical protein